MLSAHRSPALGRRALSSLLVTPTTIRAVGAAALAVAVLIHLPSLGQPLLEAHPFRQTQTAFTTLLFHEQGIDLLHPKLPVLGPPWEVPLEFPLFQALASLVMDLGVAPDTAMRSTGLAIFLVTAGLTWTLARRVGTPSVGIITLGAFLFSPLALLWSRSALIEYLATALGLGYVLLCLHWIDHQGSRVAWVAAILVGALAMLVKITTGVLYLIPVLVMGSIALRKARDRSLLGEPVMVAALLTIVIPVGAGLLWTHHADAIKAASEFTAQLTSANLTAWNFGTLSQKFDVIAWVDYLGRTNILAFGGLLLLWTPITIAGSLRSSAWGMALSAVLAVWTAPIIFTNLYFVHDYYLIAISPFVALGFGLGLSWLARSDWPRGRIRVRGDVLAALCLLFWLAMVMRNFSYWEIQYQGTVDAEGALLAADAIVRETDSGDHVVITSRDWSPAALYYARRWELMWTGSLETATTEQQLQRFRDLGYVKLLDCPWGRPCSVADLHAPRMAILQRLGVEP